MSRKLLAILAALGLFAVAGCNTMEGAGEDISAAGDTISDKAR